MDASRDTQYLISQLPPWVRERRTANQEERRAYIELRRYQNLADAEPILSELRDSGFPISNLQDLCRREIGRASMVPIIIKWLRASSNISIKTSLARALAVPWARNSEAPIVVVEEFVSLPEIVQPLKWTLGNTLSEIADSRIEDQLIEIVENKAHGHSRQMVVVALSRMPKSERILNVLVKLLDDDEVAGHAIIALRKLKATQKHAEIGRLLHHPTAWIRAEAKGALAALSK